MVVADVLKSLPEIRHISYLPLAHVYERFNVTLLTYHGGAIGFYRGDVLTLLDDIEALKPTTFAVRAIPEVANAVLLLRLVLTPRVDLI
jgi:long-chain acyl-CoA synthetase